MDMPIIDFDTILSLSSVHIYWLDRDNIYRGCSNAMALAFGLFSRTDIVGKKNQELPVGIKNPEAAIAWDNTNLQVMETGKQQFSEESVTLMDGTRAVFLSHKMPLYDNDGIVAGMLGIATNITNQKLHEHKLKEEKEKAEFTLEYIISHLPAHIYWKDKSGIYLGSNDEQARSLGLHCANEVIGKTDEELPWGIEKAIVFRENDLEVMNTGAAKITEEPSIVNGKSAIVLSHKVPLKTRDGEIIGIIGISIDITERKKAEQLAKEKEIITEKLALTEAFTGFMAHELRTPIASFNTTLDTIEGNENTHGVAERQKILSQIITRGKQTVRGANTFIDMLLYKLRNIDKGVKNGELVLCLILDDVIDALAEYPFTEIECTQITFNKEKSFVYRGNSLHTKHVIFNLLKNALKIIDEEKKGHITISFEQNEDYNCLIFTDTAKGISSEFLPTIFDAFVTKDETKKGTGLGLAYCKLIMQGYDGDIICESKLGECTKFICNFPKVNMDEI